MFNKLTLTSLLLLSSLIIMYPSKKENTSFFDYCFSLEKIIARNSLEKSKNALRKYKKFANDITLFGTNKTKGALVHKVIDQYKISKKIYIITLIPNEFYCLAGYWIESVKPGTFQFIIYEKSKQKINQYRNIKKEIDKFIKDKNLEYKSIKNEINNIF